MCFFDGVPCFTVCGDGIVAGAEECDDQNTVDGDGCSRRTCKIEADCLCINELDKPS